MNRVLVVCALLVVLAQCGALGLRSFTAPAANLCAFKGISDDSLCLRNHWTRQGVPSPDAAHKIVFAVKLKDGADATCDTLLMQAATPDSPFFGRKYSHEEVGALLSDRTNTRVVEQWLTEQQVPFTTTSNGEFITVEAPVATIESLLKAKFHTFISRKFNGVVTRTASYALPDEVAAAVDFVGNTINFPSIKAKFATPLSKAKRDSNSVTPQFIWSYHGVDNTTTKNSATTQSLFEALGQSFSPSDLATFQRQYNLANYAVGKVIGPNDPSTCTFNPNNCAEANLDVQYIMAVAQKAPTTFWSIDPNSQDPFLDWIVALAGTTNPPLVHSISYGSIATEDPIQDIKRFNTEVCKLGLKGLTVMVSSGDDGVANFEARNDPGYCGFNPSFPATSPYVVAVGATQGPESNLPEIACSSSTGGIITTGGGFSVFLSRPSYQDKAVENYLANAPNLPPKNQFNSKGRGYPDVAVLGFNYQVVIGGSTYLLSGTSASSPVFAGFISLINDNRFAQGKGPVGFINPVLYTLGATPSYGVFKDITVGENNCCAGEPGQQVCCQYGFNATTGWDPLTGWGSVNFPKLRSALTSIIP